jgi:hypothetical protein
MSTTVPLVSKQVMTQEFNWQKKKIVGIVAVMGLVARPQHRYSRLVCDAENKT